MLTFDGFLVGMEQFASPAGQIGNVAFPPGEAIRGPSRLSAALDPEPTAQTDPEPTFMAGPVDSRGGPEADVRIGC